MAVNLNPAETSIYRIVQSIIQIIQGRTNSVGLVTLRANQTTTVVAWPNCGKDSQIFFTAKTANAVSIAWAVYVKTADVMLGSFTVSHPSNAATDLIFAFDCRG